MAQKQVAEPEISPAGYTPEEEAVHKALLDAGIVKEIRPRSRQSKLNRPLGKVIGKPVSETILEDRR
jgi:hypothetical protein